MARKPFARLEDVLGAIVLIVAFFALGVFDFKKEDPLVEAGLQAAAGEVLQSATHEVAVEVDGRDLLLTGLVDSEPEKTRLLKGLRDIKGRGDVSADVQVLELAEPFLTVIMLGPDGSIKGEGAVPSEAARRRLADVLDHELATLQLASGAPDGWTGMATSAVRALMQLEQGRVTLNGAGVTLEGVAMTPLAAGQAERLLTAAPAGVTVDVSLDLLDDGSPLRLSVRQAVEGKVTMAGKVPEGMMLEGYDLSQVVRTPVPPPMAGWVKAVTTGLEALDILQVGQLNVTGRTMTLTGEAWSDQAMTRVTKLFAEVPDEMAANLGVVQMDDGQPFDITVKYDGTRALASGKIPRDLPLRVQAAFLDRPVQDAGVTRAQVSAGADWWTAATLGLEALKHFEQGEMRVREGHLALSGQAFGPQEKADIEAALKPLPEAVSLSLDLTLRDDGSPARLMVRFDGHDAVAEGKLPEGLGVEQVAASLGADVLDGGLSVAYLPVEKEFSSAIDVGLTALSAAEEGMLSVVDGTALLRATLRDPEVGERVAAAMAKMPESYATQADLSYLDDGRPFYLTMTYDGAVAVSGGKVPRDLGLVSQKAIFGRAVRAGDLAFADILASPEWWGAARAGIVGLSMLDNGVLEVDTDVIRLSGQVADDRQLETIERRLSYLPEGFSAQVALTLRDDSGQTPD
jgi:hypothetical protein